MKIVSNRPTITRKELEAVLDCLINDELIAGESVKNFESSIAKMIGMKYALATNSLTSAYHLAYCALGIGGDDEVIMPSFYLAAPLSALTMTGGKAVVLDNESDSLFPSIADIKSRITEKTKAIVAGHLFGFQVPLQELVEANVPLIEDISHSIGTEIDDIPSGRNGSITVTSFDPAGIITTGNGGMVLTNNSKFYSVMKDYRSNGSNHINYDYAMPDFQGAMGISQLARLQDLLARRREIAKIYHESLRVTSHKTPLLFNERFAYQSFPVLFTSSNEKIESYWKKSRIEVSQSIACPLHRHLGFNTADFPNAERYSKKLFSIPLYPTLSRRDVEKIAKSIASFI